MKGLHWNIILSGNEFNSFILENKNFVEIRFIGRTLNGNRIDKVRIN